MFGLLSHTASSFVRHVPLLLLFLCSMAAVSSQSAAQSFSLFEIDPSGFPTIRGKVVALDSDNNPISLSESNLELRENGVRRDITLLSCPEPAPIQPISSVLTIDISSSMRESGARNMLIAQAAARAWINGMALGVSECAITSFNTESFLNQDFTIDSRRLLNAVNSLQSDGSTSYNSALISPKTGAIPVAIGGKHRRVIVFLTDGRGGVNRAEVIRQANDADITIHCITIGFPATPELKTITAQTGGILFENVTTPERAVEIYKLLLRQAQGGDPCTIEWKSEPACDSLRTVTLDETSRNLQSTGSYIAPASSVARLQIDKKSLRFGLVDPGSTGDVVVRLTAEGNPVRILSITTADPRIVPVSNNAPPEYTIPAGGFRDVTFRYSATDKSPLVAKITIATDGCSYDLYAGAGEWSSGTPPDIQLVVPNGGERYPVGSTADITWTGVLPADTVTLEYSIDAGNSWNPITEKATGLIHPWLVPDSPSEICLARVSVDPSGGGGGGVPLFEKIAEFERHVGKINVARFSPDGQYVASGSSEITDDLDVWNSLTEQLYRSFTPAGEVLDLDFSGDGTLLAAAIAGNSWVVYNVPSRTTHSRGTDNTGRQTTAISFNPSDPDVLVTGNSIGEVTVWDVSTSPANQVRTFATGLGGITSIDYSPTTDEVVVAGHNDTVKVFGTNGSGPTTFPRNFNPGHSGNLVTSVRYSGDGQRIVSTAYDGQPRVWDRFGAAAQHTLGGHNDAAFSPDGSLIVTGGGLPSQVQPDVARLWSTYTGNQVGSITEHTGLVTTVDITSYAGRTYILTGSTDSTVMVWELQSEDSGTAGASDVSDNLWAIVASGVSSRDIDFGEVLVGSWKDSTLTGYIRNTGGIDLTLQELRLSGSYASNFEIVSGAVPQSIPAGGSAPIELRFSPDAVGPFDAQLTIVTDIDTLVQNVSGIGVNPRLLLNASVIDFGLVEVGSRKDTTVDIVMTNIGTAPLTISRTWMRGPDDRSFSVLGGGAPFTLGPNETRTMSFRFEPYIAGRTSGSMGIEFNGPGSPAGVLLYGEGFCPSSLTRASATIGDVTGAPGDTVTLPFSMQALEGPVPPPPGPATEPLGFTATFAFNKTILAPINRTSTTESGSELMLDAYGTWDPTDSTVEWADGPLQFIAALGNAESTPIRLEGLEWDQGCPPDLATNDGEFTLTELCRDGGTRLFNADGVLKLSGVDPNPATERIRIEYEIIESGPTTLYAVGMDGRRVATLMRGEIDAGAYALEANVSEWSQGSYVLVLETPTAQLTRRIEVAR